MTSEETAYRLGYAAFPLILLAIAAYVGWRMGKKRQPPKFVAWPMAVAAILLALSMIGTQLTKNVDAVPPTREIR